MTDDSRPPRGYSWPEAEPGNMLAVKHGGFSDRLISAEAEAMKAELVEMGASWLVDLDTAAVDAWLWCEARVLLVRRWIDGRDPGDEQAQRVEDRLLRWERHAMSARERLGLDPLSRSKLGKDSAIARRNAEETLSMIVERGRSALAAREFDNPTEGDDQDDDSDTDGR